MFDLYNIAKIIGLKPRAVAEIGVNEPHLSAVRRFHGECPMILVEPLTDCASALIHAYPQARVICAAIADQTGTAKFYPRGQTSWLMDLPRTPAIDEDKAVINPDHIVDIATRRFDDIDPGNLDIVAIDTEGAEWFVLKHMISRPKLLCVETHNPSRRYTNPYLAEIVEWTDANGYIKLGEEFADSLYALP